MYRHSFGQYAQPSISIKNPCKYSPYAVHSYTQFSCRTDCWALCFSRHHGFISLCCKRSALWLAMLKKHRGCLQEKSNWHGIGWFTDQKCVDDLAHNVSMAYCSILVDCLIIGEACTSWHIISVNPNTTNIPCRVGCLSLIRPYHDSWMMRAVHPSRFMNQRHLSQSAAVLNQNMKGNGGDPIWSNLVLFILWFCCGQPLIMARFL